MSLFGNLLKTVGTAVKTAAPALLPGAITGVAGLAAAGVSKLIGGKAAATPSAPISTSSGNFVAVTPPQQQTAPVNSLVIKPDGTIQTGPTPTPAWLWPVIIVVFLVIIIPVVLYFVFGGNKKPQQRSSSSSSKGGKKK